MKSIESWQNNTADKELLRRCKQAITETVDDAEVILYGSHARGEAGKYSDYDLMVLVDGPVNMALEEKIIDKIFPIELEFGEVLTLIIYNKQQWNSPLYRAMPFHKNVDRDGVIL